jgi:hypothetical protein
MDGNAIVGNGLLREWTRLNGEEGRGDERLSYLPFDMACGTSIELLWEDPVTGVVHRRNGYSKPEFTTSKSAPRLDSVVVLGAEIEKVSKVYTDLLQLERLDTNTGIDRHWMGLGGLEHAWINGNSNSIWIELIAPHASGSTVGAHKTLTEGDITELCVEVDSIDKFHDEMLGKGFVMTAGDTVALPDGEKAVMNSETGDRYAYLPRDKSCGMRIMVFERGKGNSSAYAQRDALA